MASENKQTVVGEIPKEWEVVKLRQVVEVNRESRDPSKEMPDQEFLYVDIESVEAGTGVIKKAERIMGKDAPSRARRVMHQGDVIMSTVRPYLKAFAIVPKEYENQVCSTGFAVLTCGKAIMPEYLLYALFSSIVMNQLNRMMVGGQYPALNESQVSEIALPLPPLPEQRQIAQVLGTVGVAIQKVDEVVVKTERLKRGLMRELLTKGIGHTEFRDTEIGVLPKTWEVVRLEDACKLITDGAHGSPKHQESGYPLATVANMRSDFIDVDSCYRISKEDYEELVKSRDKPEMNDVLFSKDGTVGLSIVFTQAIDLVVLSSIAILRPDVKRVNPHFLKYVLQSNSVLNRITASKIGTAIKRIILRDLCKVRIPLPRALEEQERIAEILMAADKWLELERKRKDKLERIKKGLMNDLLTVRKRVKVAG